MLKTSKVRLELLQDYDMRGGLSCISERYGRANNQEVPKFDAEKPTSYIFDLDINNLYGCAMMEKIQVNFYERKKDATNGQPSWEA